jgi:hypothetical protein
MHSEYLHGEPLKVRPVVKMITGLLLKLSQDRSQKTQLGSLLAEESCRGAVCSERRVIRGLAPFYSRGLEGPR